MRVRLRSGWSVTLAGDHRPSSTRCCSAASSTRRASSTSSASYALWGAALVIFIECWLFPFLPGDSLLFLVGLLISQQEQITVPIWLACLVLTVAAILSNVVGYAVGYKVGPAIFNRPDSRFFKQEYIDKTFAFFDKYGNRAIVLARFVPIVRTFITLAAGVGGCRSARFITYSAIGGVLWATGVTLLGLLARPGRLPGQPHRPRAARARAPSR